MNTFKAIGAEAKLSLIIICRQMWLEWRISESKNTIQYISQQDHSKGVNAGFWAPKSKSQNKIYEDIIYEQKITICQTKNCNYI